MDDLALQLVFTVLLLRVSKSNFCSFTKLEFLFARIKYLVFYSTSSAMEVYKAANNSRGLPPSINVRRMPLAEQRCLSNNEMRGPFRNHTITIIHSSYW